MTTATTPTLRDLIATQREKTALAEAAWEMWMAERSKLNALCKYAKAEVSVG